ncbi:TPA: alpha/beta hydrolase [Pseudomonas putida]|uniref:alpha/beta fold hydrolase n=1 Tax=Pseudomonas putida TaxID=303 RepID=UPI001045FB90|nr:alpha/beta hydrolase [Pseudomonas putida]MCS4061147.1 pimeloyl-ACP methyl ester carboxylesterase [Pseudomonas putida]MDD1993399.1 alpha/beta hydrolase [Pseudomonas putida]TCP79572.1 pimeloyl-ACP methyl ester carboxylesterase [Pseudomonas putida]HDS0921101.1 alpha/beta hydrolase [Pseudomonas putida]HDS0936391.1 alpha/beta hydrolase [Pseudomonas putida]
MRIRTLLAAIGTSLSLGSVLAAPSQPVPVAGERISVTVEGTGPDVILIPGLASSREVWAGLASTLRKQHRLHLVQVAGFAGLPAVPAVDGRVAAPVAEAVAGYIRSQRLEAPAVIGHSLGGEVALMLGARHPEQVGRLMVVDALPFYTLLIDPTATAETAAPQAAAFRDGMLLAPAAQAEAMQRTAIDRLAKTTAARPALVEAALRSDRRAVADATYELMTTDLRPELGSIQSPVQVVYAYDPLYGIPAASVDATFANAYAGARNISFKRIDGSFHFVMLDQPQAFAEAVVGFLDR